MREVVESLILVDPFEKYRRADCYEEKNSPPDGLHLLFLVVEGLWCWLFLALLRALGRLGRVIWLGLGHFVVCL